jgi:DNA-binding NtrC family response regulator
MQINAVESKPRADRGRVLVVDDSMVIRAVVSHILSAAGFSVSQAEDGLAAVRMLDRADFDVVITDMQMPGLDGLGVLAAVRERRNGTEVIILTGAQPSEMATAVRAIQLGAHDILTKPPAGPEVLARTVDKAVEKKRLHEAATQVATAKAMRKVSTGATRTGLRAHASI